MTVNSGAASRVLSNCNGLMVTAALMPAILSGSQSLAHAVSQLQATFAESLPSALPHASPKQELPRPAAQSGVAAHEFQNQ